jgi:hypothetical protein
MERGRGLDSSPLVPSKRSPERKPGVLFSLHGFPMSNPGTILGKAVITGSIASAVSAAILGLLAKVEGKGAIQPINATSHWLHGEKAWGVTGVDVEHTATGYATHHAATVFWAALFETLQSASPEAGLGKIIRNAALVSTIAAVVDYGLVPKRLTPGWEGPLPIRSVAGGFVGMAFGLAIGGLASRRVMGR